MDQIVVLGGGAAGIVAAIAAAEALPQAKVVLLEQNQRIGKKLLATGNGRCNLDNRNLSPERYLSSDPSVMEQMLHTIGKHHPLNWFTSHGLMTRTDAEGRVYPYSNQASDVLNLLLYWLAHSKVEVITECRVRSLKQQFKGYQVWTEDGRRFAAQAVICAFGGKAAPQFGIDGFGGQFASACGLHIQPEYPCLVPLRCDKTQIAGLSGIRVKARASLYEQDRLIKSEDGEVQFTEQGLSGIAVMQLSNHMRKKNAAYSIHLNLFPQLNREELSEMIGSRIRLFADAPCTELMTGLLHKRIGAAMLRSAGIADPSRLVRTLVAREMLALHHALSDWVFDHLSPFEWKQAQVTGGGIDLGQLEPDSFMLKGCPGLYFVGEMLDCVGDCGGYNLHFAFGSGITSGIHAAQSLRGKIRG